MKKAKKTFLIEEKNYNQSYRIKARQVIKFEFAETGKLKGK